MSEFEQDTEWAEIDEEIYALVRAQENLQNAMDYLDKQWESLIIRKARIEERIENE